MAEDQPRLRKKIGCQQVLLKDSSVFSTQWMVLPPTYKDTITPAHLLDRYLNHVRLFTFSLIRPFQMQNQVEFRLLGTRISLISFTGPAAHDSDRSQALSLSISGGVLVQKENCHRGELTFITKQIGNGLKVILQLSDFCPMLLGSESPSRLRKLLYRLTQAYIHKIVTVQFLARLYSHLEGVNLRVRVVKVKLREGEDT
jgi:hypothetical protein